VVIPELVRFEPLDRNVEAWADAVLEQAAKPRDIGSANKRVAASPFAVENSAAALMKLYSGNFP
jgi:hypothetical protein